MNFWVSLFYFIAAVLFIIGLKQMASPVNARRGIEWAGAGMVLATVITFIHPAIHGNYLLIVLGIGIGGALAWYSGKRVAMTDMPQMIALYNGMGGGAAAAIAAVELIRHHEMSTTVQTLAVLGALIGAMAFSGSLIAYGKLQGLKALRNTWRFNGQKWLNA
ncbi:MAG: NAD(P)(+) transhydrogenase (Re/Si-specific) subunit beta, partial [Thiolinea sp.]